MVAKKKKDSRWQKVRKFFNDIHLWTGLASGIIVIVVCFSGTVYVFNTEFKEMASPELYTLENTDQSPLPVEQIIADVEKSTGGKVTLIKIPADKGRTWQVSIKKESEGKKGNESSKGKRENNTPKNKEAKSNPSNAKPGAGGPPAGGRPNMGTVYAVNPYTGSIVGNISETKNGTTEFMRTMFSLHRWLMLDRVEEPIFGELPNRKLGSYITGTATILFTLGVLTGMIIWFPRKIKSWKQGLKIKWDAKWKRVNHDLHNTLAFYSLIFLFLMGVTGPQWSFEWYREGLQKTLGTYRPADAPRPEQPMSVIPTHIDTTQQHSIHDFIAAVDKILPYTGDYAISLAGDSTATVQVSKNRTGFFAPAAGDKVYLDQYTASVVKTDIFRDKKFNERIAGSIKALHLGDVYGTFTKILYFIACLIATSLPVTGTIIWINKFKKKDKAINKKKKLVEQPV